jgi:hypothetical protein
MVSGGEKSPEVNPETSNADGGRRGLGPDVARPDRRLTPSNLCVGAAVRLFVTVNTIRSHVRNIYEKLHVHSRSQAVHAAIKQGIL